MKAVKKTGMYLFLYAFLLFAVVPFLWLLLSSFRPNMELFTNPFSLPETWTLENYRKVLDAHPMWLYLLNTFAAAMGAMAIAVVAAVLASYAFLYKFRLKPAIHVFVTLGMFIPTNAFMVPYYLIINRLGLYDSVAALMLVYAAVNLPLTVMIIKGFVDTIPHSILESAYMDGAGSLRTLVSIVAPISVPGIVTSCVFLVLNCWNELLFANLLTQSERARTVQVAIRFFLTTFGADYAQAFAAMALSILPTIVVYIFLTDKIVDGMTAGAVKS